MSAPERKIPDENEQLGLFRVGKTQWEPVFGNAWNNAPVIEPVQSPKAPVESLGDIALLKPDDGESTDGSKTTTR